jgi:Zn-dependent protease
LTEENPDSKDPKRKWRREIHSLISAVAFSMAVAFVFQSWEMAWLITLSLVFHELGHILAISRLGLDWELGFNILGAWTMTSRRARLALSDYRNSIIHLAGPFASLLLAFLTYLVAVLVVPSTQRQIWLSLANFNALLCVLNLLPMGSLSDGGKFVRRMFSSADERLEERLLALVGVVPLVFACIILTMRLDWARVLSMLVIVLWFGLSMLVESRLDDPAQSSASRAMKPRQARELLSAMILVLLASMGIVVITPFWINPEHIAKMILLFSRSL